MRLSVLWWHFPSDLPKSEICNIGGIHFVRKISSTDIGLRIVILALYNMLCPIKVTHSSIELTMHTSCSCVSDLLCVTYMSGLGLEDKAFWSWMDFLDLKLGLWIAYIIKHISVPSIKFCRDFIFFRTSLKKICPELKTLSYTSNWLRLKTVFE